MKIVNFNLEKPNKFGAKKVTIDGITFDSKKEGKYYSELKIREKLGEVSDILTHVPHEFHHNGKKIFRYECDFVFFDNKLDKQRYVDVKGLKKGAAYQIFRLKKKLIESDIGIEIEEV